MTTQTISLRDALALLTEDLLVPSPNSDAVPYGGVNGSVHVNGYLKGVKVSDEGVGGQLASAAISRYDGAVTFTVHSVVPRRWNFTTTILNQMVTEENIQAFADYIKPRIFEAVSRDA